MRHLAAFVALLACLPAIPAPAYAEAPATTEPVVVIAHIDQGINPYHRAFRDEGPLAYVHPSEYLDGYPADTPALWLSLNETSWEAAFAKDNATVWDPLFRQWANTTVDPATGKSPRDLLRGQMFWIPGTRIVAAVRFGTGGVYCPAPAEHPPPMLLVYTRCRDNVILDDYGHGTMTATRMAGKDVSLCPRCRIVTIEGLGGASVRWAADRGWIDVQTNSWLSLVPPPANQLDVPGVTGVDATTEAFAHAQSRMLTYAASGNGAGYIGGVAPTPTYVLSTAAPGVILAGAHDNGHVSTWSGAPAHVVADGYAGLTARRNSLDAVEPSVFACCTSAAAPYAAGGGAGLLYAARALAGDTGTGLRGGCLVVGTAVAGGPLADGCLSIDDARTLVRHSAEARPAEGAHDGAKHWLARVGDGDLDFASDPAVARFGAGANPYCGNCWNLPVQWSSVPDDAPAYASIGYGAVNERALAAAVAALGGAPLPDRSDVDAFFALDAALRAPFFADPS